MQKLLCICKLAIASEKQGLKKKSVIRKPKELPAWRARFHSVGLEVSPSVELSYWSGFL